MARRTAGDDAGRYDMGELQSKDKAGPEQGKPEQAAAARPAHPIVSMVETMVSSGKGSPTELAAVLRAHPYLHGELIALLHRIVGNSVVQMLLSLVTGG